MISAIVFRYLTDADFFNINKPTGTEAGGGGQSYIDFPTSVFTIEEWNHFFDGVRDLSQSTGTVGPVWSFPIYSIGLPRDQKRQLKIYQRRPHSVSIASQKIHSQRSNRIRAWHPTFGFPKPNDPSNRHQLPTGLAVYLVKTNAAEVWAGWFMRGNAHLLPSNDQVVLDYLSPIFLDQKDQGDAGVLYCGNDTLILNENDPRGALCRSTALKPLMVAPSKIEDQQIPVPKIPKTAKKKKGKKTSPGKHKSFSQVKRSEEQIIESLFSEDSDFSDSTDKTIVKENTKIRKRNRRAIVDLKALYQHSCQISGKKYLFKKKDGTYYTEAHHLVPLGEGGADNPLNIVILSPLLHRMLHYADVKNLDLSKITLNPDGKASLDITINKKKYTISWKRKHYEMIMKYHKQE